MFSSIRLGDSYLSLYDLYHLKLPVELVVLSGCATGLNVITPGDELIGLVRGLLQAGAQSLVLSLWDVHDASTREFMVAFYSGLQCGMTKPAALQAAAGSEVALSPPILLGPFPIDRKGVSCFFGYPYIFLPLRSPLLLRTEQRKPTSTAKRTRQYSSKCEDWEWSIFRNRRGLILYVESVTLSARE